MFPRTPFLNTGDEKGGGGGGGAGGLEILAIGDIAVIGSGSITADGGTGSAGESTSFFDRIGGGSGGGSGGHIVLSSANNIILSVEATDASVMPFYADDVMAVEHVMRPLSALGGQGGAGRESECGSNEEGEMRWVRDSIPIENFEGNLTVPPNDQFGDPSGHEAGTYFGLQSWNRICSSENTASCSSGSELGEALGAGGDGGPGLIQLLSLIHI